MKFTKKGTIKEFKGSSKVTALGSILLTGATESSKITKRRLKASRSTSSR